jgi:hypothetical protein
VPSGAVVRAALSTHHSHGASGSAFTIKNGSDFPIGIIALVIIVAPVGWRFAAARKSRFRDRLESAFSRYDRP